MIASWTASTVAISINGQAFTSVGGAAGIPQLQAVPISLGGASSAASLRSDVLWLALGKGTLSNADAAAIHAQGNSDPEQLPGAASAIWQANDGSVLVPGYGTTPETTRYSYDALGRLEHVQLPDGTQRGYRFDLNSNRTQIVEDGQTVATYTYNPNVTPGVDQLTSVTHAGQQPIPYVYSADGEVTGRGADTLAWDGRGRHSGGSFNGTSVGYGFDAAGFRRARTSAGVTRRFLLGGHYEANTAGTILLTDIDGPAGDLGHFFGPPTSGSHVVFNYYDGHGNLAARANLQGASTRTIRYDPFGTASEPPPANQLLERFTARWDKKLDVTSGLVEVERRSVVRDAKLAKFLGIPPTGGEVAIFVPIHETEEHPEGAEPYWVKSVSVAHVHAVVELATLPRKTQLIGRRPVQAARPVVHETDVDSFRSTMFLVSGPLPNPFVARMLEDSPHLELEDSVDEIALRCKGLPRDSDRFVIRPPRGERTIDQVERETTYGVVQKVASERLTKVAIWGLDERVTRGAARWLAENWSRPAKEFDEGDFVAIVQLPPREPTTHTRLSCIRTRVVPS